MKRSRGHDHKQPGTRCRLQSHLANTQVGGAEGIVNGMDVTEWNPKTDKYVPVKYDRNTVFEGKTAAKAALQAELGLPVDPTTPVFGYIGRLEEQKGVDILLAVSSRALDKLLQSCVQPSCSGDGFLSSTYRAACHAWSRLVWYAVASFSLFM